MVNCLKISLFWSSHPILVICLQKVCKLVWIPLLIILSFFLHPSPGCTWTWSIVWKYLVWSSYPILATSSYVNLVVWLNISLLIISSLSLHPSRMYVNLVDCFNTSHLIIPSYPYVSSSYVNVVKFWNTWSSHSIFFIPLQKVRGLN